VLQDFKNTILNATGLVFVFNIAVSFYPLLMPMDNLTDIPLTPSQRALLGLDPNATPLDTPATQCVTPPRYPRSSTSRSGSPASRGSNSTRSPLSHSASPSLGGDGSESLFSASASTIWQKSVGGPRDSLRRNSFGSPSPRSIGMKSNDVSVLAAPSTPSPVPGKGASIGLNNKWLYERRRVAPGSRGPKIYV
jgi:nucleoporin POM34